LGVLFSILPLSSASASFRIEVSLSERELIVFDDDTPVERYEVAVGKLEKPTPTGEFSIRKVIWNPSWTPPNEPWAKGKSTKAPGDPENPMKLVKMFFREPDYYIHGTGEVESLGLAASHGCIRMSPDDVTQLARIVMEKGGKPKPQPWYRSILSRRSNPVVVTIDPVPIVIRE
jgi:lipoprotein-anchoring transpeptidase ErfK/SrfK